MKLFYPEAITESFEFKDGNAEEVCCQFLEFSGNNVYTQSLKSSPFINIDSIIRILRRGHTQNIHIAISDKSDLKKAFLYAHSVSIWTFEFDKVCAEIYINKGTSTYKKPFNDKSNVNHIISALSEIFEVYVDTCN
jgi:hypothetical protein